VASRTPDAEIKSEGRDGLTAGYVQADINAMAESIISSVRAKIRIHYPNKLLGSFIHSSSTQKKKTVDWVRIVNYEILARKKS
jgi:hypothetical protein